jgi:hypothetical protein
MSVEEFRVSQGLKPYRGTLDASQDTRVVAVLIIGWGGGIVIHERFANRV